MQIFHLTKTYINQSNKQTNKKHKKVINHLIK